MYIKKKKGLSITSIIAKAVDFWFFGVFLFFVLLVLFFKEAWESLKALTVSPHAKLTDKTVSPTLVGIMPVTLSGDLTYFQYCKIIMMGSWKTAPLGSWVMSCQRETGGRVSQHWGLKLWELGPPETEEHPKPPESSAFSNRNKHENAMSDCRRCFAILPTQVPSW